MDLYHLAERPAGEQSELMAFLRETFVQRTRDEWVAWFAEKDVAFAPVLDFREALHQPNISERGLWIEHDKAHHIAPAIRFASEQWLPSNAPELNADG